MIKRFATILISFLFMASLSAQDEVLTEAVKKATAELSKHPSRLIGSEGHKAAAAHIKEKIQKLEGFSLVTQKFPIIMPITKKSEMVISGGNFKGSHRVYPVWPDAVRLKTTGKDGITGKAIYIKDADYKDIPAKSLRDNIAVVEMASYRSGKWLRAFDFGAKAILLLGSDDDSAWTPDNNSIYKPRYYVPAGELANSLRTGEIKSEMTIYCEASWESVEGENIIALKAGSDPNLEPVLLIAPYDAMSVIPDLSPGADHALDAAFLLEFMAYLSKHQPKRSVMIAFIDGFGINMLGIRELSAMLTARPGELTRETYQKEMNKTLKDYETVAAQVEKLGTDPVAALTKLNDKATYQTLQEYVKADLSPEILRLRAEILQLRLDEVKLEDKAAREAAAQKKKEKIARKAELDAIISGIINKGKLPEKNLEEAKQVWQHIMDRSKKQLADIKAQAAIFENYDATRKEILTALNIPESKEIPIPFMMGFDMSDAGVNMGPGAMCESLYWDYSKDAKDYTKWLKKLLRRPEPFKDVSADRLKALGVNRDLKDLVQSIINRESLDAANLKEIIITAMPDVSDATMQEIINAVRRGKSAGNPNPGEGVTQILQKQMPYESEAQIRRLVNAIVNSESIQGSIDSSSMTVEPLTLLTSVCRSFQMSGATWMVLEALRPRLDTPQDTYERLDWSRIIPQIQMTSLILESMLNDPEFEPKNQKARAGSYPKWHTPDGIVVTETIASTISYTPSPNMLVSTINNRFMRRPPLVVRQFEFIRSGVDGRFRFRPAPAAAHWPARNRQLKAYRLDEAGRIIQGVAKIESMLTEKSAGSQYSFAFKPPLASLRGEIFDCMEINGPMLWDPRYQNWLGDLGGTKVIDVNRGGKPKKYQWRSARIPGPIFGLLEPDTNYQLILGHAGNTRMALINVPKNLNEQNKKLRYALQEGFDASKSLPELPELISAKDFYRIDEWRLRRLEAAGVSCKPIRMIQADSKAWIEKADKAYEADDGAGYKQAANAALSSEIRVYHAAQNLADDVTRGAIFLLLLLVPFAICLERLLFASPEIGKQITRAMLIFVIMFVILASFHPGFRITSMPAVILIAFLVLLLSVSVINMILKKFRSDMELLRRGTLAEASGAQTGRGGVIASAIWLGIANMRKRLVRTLLTGATIVLVTFSLLCFTSSSTYQDKRTSTVEGISPSHQGILLQHPSNLALQAESEDSVRNLLGNESVMAARYWVVDSTQKNWRLNIRNPKTSELVSLKAGLGLQGTEDQFSAVGKLLKNWDKFKEGNGCYLAKDKAERLQLKVGDPVLVGGITLELLDTYEIIDFQQKIKKLDGQSLRPLDYTFQKDDGSMGSGANMESAMASADDIASGTSLKRVMPDEMIILPAEFAKRLGGDLRSLAFLPTGDEDSKSLAGRLVKLLVYPVYFGSGEEVKVIVSTPLLPKAPRKLLIPILIAALIIFNTMLNSIAERKKEIYIYSSLGLAPRHIGVLFLAEAVTYGIMGSVFGYVIGQGVATVLTHYNLMGGITLNYSGSNVILTMGLVMMVVMLSAIVPAFMAAKVASPSGDLDWKVPKPKDGLIIGDLPFTVSKQAAPGLAAFLHEYINAHKDGAIGNFTSNGVRLVEGEGNNMISLKATIWPAPYDLGVRQEMTINFEETEDDLCNLHIELTHVAGTERSWWRLNRPFLTSIRGQLLGWRNIPADRMLKYIRKSEEI